MYFFVSLRLLISFKWDLDSAGTFTQKFSPVRHLFSFREMFFDFFHLPDINWGNFFFLSIHLLNPRCLCLAVCSQHKSLISSYSFWNPNHNVSTAASFSLFSSYLSFSRDKEKKKTHSSANLVGGGVLIHSGMWMQLWLSLWVISWHSPGVMGWRKSSYLSNAWLLWLFYASASKVLLWV